MVGRITVVAVVAASLTALLPHTRALAQPGEDAYARVNESLVMRYVLPRYGALADATARLDTIAEHDCRQPGRGAGDAVRAAWHDAMDAWMAVAHITFGPVELFMRGYRMYFWPQGRGRIDDALRELAGEGEGALTPERFRDASVAAQGLPALEHLLFGDVADELPAGASCALIVAITGNLARMASGLVHEWRDGDEAFRHTMTRPGPANPFFATSRDATLALFRSFHGGLRTIADVRLGPVVGASLDEARPGLVESAASGRSLRNIRVSLRSLQAMYEGEDGPGLGDLVMAEAADAELDALMRRAFRLTIETAAGIDAGLAEAVADPALRPRVEKLDRQVRALKQIVRTRLAEATGLGVGFNALDGD